MARPAASFTAAAASTLRSRRAPASRHSTAANAIGTSGTASMPSVADSGINNVRLPACQPATAPNQRVAMRETSHGSHAPIARNGRRSASTWLPPTSTPRRASHAVSPGRSE
ncbi:hypothetical protein D3C71_1653250 [compost metagenome]